MWTAKLISKNIINKSVVVDVEVVNQDTGLSKNLTNIPYNGTVEELKKRINIEVAELDKSLLKLDAITLGPIDFTLTENQEEVDRRNYFSLLERWFRVREAIDMKLLLEDDAAVINLSNELKAAYKPEYSGL